MIFAKNFSDLPLYWVWSPPHEGLKSTPGKTRVHHILPNKLVNLSFVNVCKYKLVNHGGQRISCNFFYSCTVLHRRSNVYVREQLSKLSFNSLLIVDMTWNPIKSRVKAHLVFPNSCWRPSFAANSFASLLFSSFLKEKKNPTTTTLCNLTNFLGSPSQVVLTSNRSYLFFFFLRKNRSYL